MSIQSFLDRRHPGWELKGHWEFCIDTFEAGPNWMPKNLFRFHKEGKKEYEARLQRAYRDNISRDVIEVFTAHLFKSAITRDEDNAPPYIVDFLKRATRGHNVQTLDGFMRSVSDKSSAAQIAYVVVDVPAVPEAYQGRELTKAETDTLGLKPYVYALYPTDVLNVGLDEDGEYTWALIRETYVDDSNPKAKEAFSEERYRLWTREGWELYRRLDREPGYELITSATHPLGVVPLVRIPHKEADSPYKAVGLIDEIAYKDRAIANNESRLDCIICDQTFSTLWIPDKGLIANTERDSAGKRQRMIQSATNRAALFNDSASHIPFYLAPDAAQAGIIVELVERLRTQIWEDALLGSEGQTKSTGPRTATEAEFDFEKLNGALADKATNLESGDRRILRLVALWNGEKLSDEDVAKLSSYPRRFQVQALIDALTELLSFQKFSQLGETFWSKALERIVKRYLPDLTDEEMDSIKEEISQSMQVNDLLTSAPLFAQGIQAPPTQDPTQDPQP